jgi:hypothetical protein
MDRSPLARRVLRVTALSAVAGACMVLSFGCLRRPTSKEQPTTKISFDTVVPQPAIDKIDLLVMVDNSASMADKQKILAQAVPDLVTGLVRPKCVDKKTRAKSNVLSDPTKPEKEMCPAGMEPAFSPITDMHIGIISSSLGGMGSDNCKEGASADRNDDDHGHLLARGPDGKDVKQAGDLHFLAWYPDVEKNKDKVRHPDPPVPKTADVSSLSSAFRDLVVGVGQRGCGLEAQLESVYHFLAQPDPWTSITRDAKNKASYGPEIDDVLLKQRAAFLRPDSLVAVVLLTDEDDSSADALAFQGSGWRFMEDGARDRPTAACASQPSSDKCTSCAFTPSDPGCEPRSYTAKEDDLNVRFHRMKERFGVDPQFPVQRYIDALTKNRVPLRDKEHDANGNYVPKPGCTNPLFASKLPTNAGDELCALPRGPRTPGLIYFAVIGGVPNKLLPDLDKNSEAKIDWTPILGLDPNKYDETGISPYMVQSTKPRKDLPPPGSADDADPVNGREWTTDGSDLQFACIFDLYETDETSGAAKQVRRVCPENDKSCDCNGEKDTPLCAAEDRRVQIKGKAYPTRRELMVAKELEEQGVVASLCPKQLTNASADDYGYRPAVRTITDRLERSLVGSCLPRELTREGDGKVACSVLAILPDETPNETTECARFGLKPPSAALAKQLRERLVEDEDEASTKLPICEVPQISVEKGETCRDASEDIAFCYAEAQAITKCAHSLSFTKASQKLNGARFTMQCIQQTKQP